MGPLQGISVLDLTRLLPGPHCTMLLQRFGADVLKVEDTASGDYLRSWPPHYPGDPDRSAMFSSLNAGKGSLRVDLKQPQGKEVFKRLVAQTDLVVESFRPGVMARLGLGYDVLKEIKSDLIYCAISGYGQQGAFSQRPGHDLNFLARSGMLSLSGQPGQPPPVPGTQVADIGGGALAATVEILAALRLRDQTGEGAMLDISMTGQLFDWLRMPQAVQECAGVPPVPGGELLTGGFVCYNTYGCKDGKAVALGALEPKFWLAFCEAVGREDLIDKQFAKPGSEVHGQLVELFASRSQAEWAEFSERVNCCLDPILELDEAFASELAPAVSSDLSAAAPLPGADTAAELRRVGYSEAEIAELSAAGITA